MDYKLIGEYISIKRKQKNMTQKDLASKLHLTDKAVSKWERGLGCPDVSILEDLSNILDVSILEILNGKDLDNSMDDKVLVDYTKNEKKKLVLNILSFIVIFISLLLLFLNINNYYHKNKKIEVDFYTVNEIRNDYEKFKKNYSIIKANKGIYNDDEYSKILEILKQIDDTYLNTELSSLDGIKYYNSNESILFLEKNNLFKSIILSSNLYDILIKYDNKYELNKELNSSLLLATGISKDYYNYKYSFDSNYDNLVITDIPVYKVLYRDLLYMKKNVEITNIIMEVGGIHE